MAIQAFPPVEFATDYGLLAIGGDLEPESLLLAYSSGIFPWPADGEDDVLWFAPPTRAVLYLKDFHLSRSMKRILSKTPFKFKLNSKCEEVISCCQATTNRPRQHGTWITDDMKAAYMRLHRLGYVHSFECYLDENLVGGVYGVSIGRAFAAESMFYRYPNASKATLWILSQYLFAQGVTWIDCQIVNPHLKSLGVIEIPREKFSQELQDAIQKPSLEFSDALLSELERKLKQG